MDRYGLIDGDILCYSLAAIGEMHRHTVTRAKDGSFLGVFEKKRAFTSWLQEHNIAPEEVNVESTMELLPFTVCQHAFYTMLERIKREAGLVDGDLYLSPEIRVGFRYDIYPQYKQNRPPKPPYYQDMRKFLESLDAIIVPDMEADDALGLAQTDKTIICTIDKDLDTVPGWHYNWRRSQVYYLSPNESHYNLYKQMLIGDDSDNIKGLKGIGPAKAAKLISGLPPKQIERVVREAYKYHIGKDWESLYKLNLKLLQIQHVPENIFPPT